MSADNPYSTPGAALDDGTEPTYEPKVFSFNGRIGRLRYLAYGLGVSMLLMFGLGILAGLMGAVGMGDSRGAATFASVGGVAVIALFSIVITIMYGKRRLNDLGHSGWWSLLLLVPYLQLLPVIYLVFFPGSGGANRFGPAPAKNSIGVVILGWAVPLLAIIGIVAAIAIPALHDYAPGAG